MKIDATNKLFILGLVVLLPILHIPSSQAQIEIKKPVPIKAEVKVGLDKYVGATELTPQELDELLRLVGFKGKALKLAWCIVMRESRGRPLAHNLSSASGDNSYGLFQINMVGSLGPDRREKFGIASDDELLDPVTNAKAAYYMSARGTNFGSWGLGPKAYDGTPSESAVTDWLSKYPG